MKPILELKGLNKKYGALDILNDINVNIDEGEFLVLVGPSGCGKSTLLNCIAGLEPVSGGTVIIDGKDMENVSPKDRDIATSADSPRRLVENRGHWCFNLILMLKNRCV